MAKPRRNRPRKSDDPPQRAGQSSPQSAPCAGSMATEMLAGMHRLSPVQRVNAEASAWRNGDRTSDAPRTAAFSAIGSRGDNAAIRSEIVKPRKNHRDAPVQSGHHLEAIVGNLRRRFRLSSRLDNGLVQRPRPGPPASRLIRRHPGWRVLRGLRRLRPPLRRGVCLTSTSCDEVNPRSGERRSG